MGKSEGQRVRLNESEWRRVRVTDGRRKKERAHSIWMRRDRRDRLQCSYRRRQRTIQHNTTPLHSTTPNHTTLHSTYDTEFVHLEQHCGARETPGEKKRIHDETQVQEEEIFHL